MESNDAADIIITVSHSGNSDLDKDVAESSFAVGSLDHNATENSDHISTTNEREKENNNDDQDSVIIEEEVNRVIDLNEETDEEIELEIVQNTSEMPNSTNDSPTKATEFVIVNAANLSTLAIDGQETAVEDIQIKDELSETITADLNTNDVLENDPMDLLELNHRSESSNSIRSQEETDYADDGSSIGSSSVQTGSSTSISVLDWIKEYPWLLYEEGDEQMGHCLYCDVKINTKSQRFVKQHGMSLYHKERCENYTAFREEEEKNGLGMKLVEIKEEFGTDSRVEALKLKRKSQSAALNNFNWRRWLEEFPWLERNCAEGTIGLCKYCRIHVNAEFSYLRDRHQESTKHKDAEKQYELSNEPQQLQQSQQTQQPNKTASTNEVKDSTAESSPSKPHQWLELVENEPLMARCKVCGSKMFKNNFIRHTTTKLHEHNEKNYLENHKVENQIETEDDSSKTPQNWKDLAKVHPWLAADPENPSFAYCKYCERRIVYGASASKRATHEHSFQHKNNEIEFKKRARNLKNDKNRNDNKTEEDNEENDSENQAEEEQQNDEEREEEEEADKDQNEGIDVNNEDDGDDDDEEEEEEEEEKENESDEESKDNGEEGEEEEEEEGEEEEEEEVDNEEEQVQEEKESENENESKKRPKILTDEWLNQYAWCKRYKNDPKNFIFCIYCRTPLRPQSRRKHENTSMHKTAAREIFNRQMKKQKLEDRKHSNENAPFFEWAIPLRNNPSSYSCLYCRVRISKNYSKKQHASSKIHQINESIYNNNRRKSSRNDENTTDSSQPATKATTQQSNIANKKKEFAKVVIKAPSTVTLIKLHQKKFPWLSYKRSELRTHYGHCKICDCSLYIRSVKHISRHVRSGRHLRILRAKKMQKVEKNEDNDSNAVSESNVIKQVSKEELQTSPQTTTEKEATVSNELESQKALQHNLAIAEMKKRYSWIEKNHCNSSKHRHFVVNSYSIDGKKVTTDKHGKTNADVGNNGSKSGDESDVLIVEDNNEEILISEQDENWTIKSETMDEHEELDYLLQRSFNNSSNMQRNVRKSANHGDEPPAKRVKRSHSFRRLNDSNSSLVASLLTTPLTLASCLGPIIQQQIQQANLSHAQNNLSITAAPETSKSPTAPLVEPENTYDLFFKSVSETMKKLPVDLAAEGKLRVMQVLCDLELQALKREQSPRMETVGSNINEGLAYQATLTPPVVNTVCHGNVICEQSAEQNGNLNETIITQYNVNTENSPSPTSTNLAATTKTTTNLINPKLTNPSTVVEKPTTSASSPIIGVMDKNGLQTLQLKTAVPKQIARNTTNNITPVANSGIRCIPFKNLSQPVTPDSSNQKISRMQVPMNVPNQGTNHNSNTVNTSKNLINFRNIQITKRMGTAPTSMPPTTVSQQTVQKTQPMTNKSPQRTYITNIQPQLQRWGCSVNGSPSNQTPTSTTVNHLQQLSSQRTSTPMSKK